MFCFIDYRTSTEEKKNLEKLGLNLIIVPKSQLLYEAINGHVDIQLNIIDRNVKKVIINRDLPKNFKNILTENSISYIESSKRLSNKYPDNIFLNGLSLGNYFIHNIKYTDPLLLSELTNKVFINVKQGYTKCSILPVRDNAVITSDIGINNVLKNYNFDVLLVPPGDIILPGLDYGFIGGVGGMISESTMAFFGNISKYKYGDTIKKFLSKYDVTPVSLCDSKLIDRGSLLVF